MTNDTERCPCEQCQKMKNPRLVFKEGGSLRDVPFCLRIMRDGRTQNYAASLAVLVSPNRTIQSGCEFKMGPGTTQDAAVQDLVFVAYESGVLDDLVAEALEQRAAEQPGPRNVDPEVRDGTNLILRIIEGALMAGQNPLEALKRRAEQVEQADPFRPIGPGKPKPYLN